MRLIHDFIKSFGGKIALALGLLAAIVQFLDLAFPNMPELVQIISQVTLLVVFVYIILYVVLRILVQNEDRFVMKLGQHIAAQLKETNLPASIKVDNSYLLNSSEAERAYEYFSKRYGAGYEYLEVECVIDDDGSALVQRTVTMHAFSEIESLDTYLLIPEKSHHDKSVGFVSVKSLTPAYYVTPSAGLNEQPKQPITLAMSPPLSDGQIVSYEMVEQLPLALFAINLSQEDIANRETTHDYFGWNINRPTRKLLLEIYFPDRISPNIFSHEIRYASASGFPATRFHHEEQKRLQRPLVIGPEGGRYKLKLEVEYPMIGLVYILRWHPPSLAKPKNQQANIVLSDDEKSHILTQLREILATRFSEGELQTLCFDLKIDYAELPANEKASMARELVAYLDRREQIPELVKLGKKQRPDIPWDELLV